MDGSTAVQTRACYTKLEHPLCPTFLITSKYTACQNRYVTHCTTILGSFVAVYLQIRTRYWYAVRHSITLRPYIRTAFLSPSQLPGPSSSCRIFKLGSLLDKPQSPSHQTGRCLPFSPPESYHTSAVLAVLLLYGLRELPVYGPLPYVPQ